MIVRSLGYVGEGIDALVSGHRITDRRYEYDWRRGLTVLAPEGI
jgi:hypothetical protein